MVTENTESGVTLSVCIVRFVTCERYESGLVLPSEVAVARFKAAIASSSCFNMGIKMKCVYMDMQTSFQNNGETAFLI